MEYVWVYITYDHDGITLEDVYATPEAAMGKWPTIWERYSDGLYVRKDNSKWCGEQIVRYQVKGATDA